MIISSIGLAIGELLMYFASNIYIAFILLVFIGLFMILFTTSVNSTLQLESDDNVRGRVMCVYSFVFVGVAPIGSMYAGALLNKLSANIAFSICGLIGIIGVMISIYFLLWRNNRNPTYKNT